MTDDNVEQMLALAERLRQANGGELDESAIQAVAEATGAPVEYVRLAVMLRAEKEEKSVFGHIRAQFVALGGTTRRYLSAAVAAMVCAVFSVTGQNIDRIQEAISKTSYGFFGMLAIVVLGFAVYNAGIARDARTASISGAIFGAGYYLFSSLLSMIVQSSFGYSEWMIVITTLLGAVIGLATFSIFDRNRQKWGLKDPVKDRQDLLRQLVELQETLRSGEQSITFLSVDIVGSTRMKQTADPLAIEFTFNEYHSYVERISRKYGGRVHSTAGDGMICAFDSPSAALGAAKNIQAELIELNSLRNKIGTPIVLRAGIHSGSVVAPDATDVTSVNFAHVIDVAAHIQKVCPPGGIAVSEASAQGIQGGMEAVGSERTVVMDLDVAIFVPRRVPSLASAARIEVPALPEGI